MAEARIKQWGNSLGIIISKDIVKEKRMDGFGIMKNIPSFKEDKEEHKEFW